MKEPTMRIATGVLLWTFTVPALADLAHAAERKSPDALLDRARYVALGYDVGHGFVGAQELALLPAHTLTEERQAIEGIRKDLANWGKYVVTLQPKDAELLIAVRVGRRASLEIGGGGGGSVASRGGRSDGRVTGGRSLGGQVSSSGDMVEVYEATGGRPGMLLWRAMESDGLSGAPPRLYKAFRDEMEKKAKNP
jgi:hypothetical protein